MSFINIYRWFICVPMPPPPLSSPKAWADVSDVCWSSKNIRYCGGGGGGDSTTIECAATTANNNRNNRRRRRRRRRRRSKTVTFSY